MQGELASDGKVARIAEKKLNNPTSYLVVKVSSAAQMFYRKGLIGPGKYVSANNSGTARVRRDRRGQEPSVC